MRRAGLLRGLVGAVAVALVAGACGTSGTEQATAPTPASRQVLNVAAAADGYYENPQYPTIGRYPTNANIFETLVRMTPDYQLAPSLATSWEFLPPNTWRFQLRKNVKFQDGTPFNAQAVKWNLDRILNPATNATPRADISSIANVPRFAGRKVLSATEAE